MSESDYDNSFRSVLQEALRGSQRDFTQGSLTLAIFLLAVPMVMEMIMESVFAVVDVFFVASLGADAVAVVGLTETMMFLVYSIAMGIAIGATATVSRRIGEKDANGAAEFAIHAIYLGGFASILMTVAGICFAPRLLQLLGAEPQVVRDGTLYTQLMLGGNIVVVLLFLLNAIFRGAGDAAVAMRVLWIANLLNCILDPLFIFGFGFFPELGVTGAAVATLVGRSVGVLFAGYQFLFSKKQFAVRAEHWAPRFERLKRLYNISWVATLQFTIGTASWIGLMRVVAGFGSEAVAGYTIAIRVVMFALLPAVGLANAAATLVGQNLGAKLPDRAERSVWKAAQCNAAFQTLIGVVFTIFAFPIASIFTDQSVVLNYAADGLRIISYGFFFYGIGMVLENSFNGAGDTWTPTFLNLFVFWLFEIPLAYILAYRFGLAAHGVFWAITLAFSMLAIVSALVFKRGRWKRIEV